LKRDNSDEDKSLKSDNNDEENNLKSNKEGQLTIYNLDEWKDPGNWPNSIRQKVKYTIVKLEPIHLKNFDFPATIQSDGSQRKFSPKLFYRILANNEKVDRVWLVYSPIVFAVKFL